MLLLERDVHHCVYFLIYFKALGQHVTVLSQILKIFQNNRIKEQLTVVAPRQDDWK